MPIDKHCHELATLIVCKRVNVQQKVKLGPICSATYNQKEMNKVKVIFVSIRTASVS